MRKPARFFRLLPVLILLLGLIPGLLPGAAAAGNGDPDDGHAELARLLAPIALYPDRLLSQVLMAATYPIEVIEADRWVKERPHLRGTSLDAALQDEPWDPSVKALCHFPDLLGSMSERIGATTDLGNAFLAREDEVMETVQELRAQAYGRGNLASTREQTVRVVNKTIIIEPRDPRVVYVPYYDPLTIYGPWWYPAFPPLYWGPPGVSLGVGLSFWPGIYFGFSWGSWIDWDWPHRVIYIRGGHARPHYVRRDRWPTAYAPWTHAPDHRRGLAYPDRGTAVRYGQPPPPPRRSPAPRPHLSSPPAYRPAPARAPGNERPRRDEGRDGRAWAPPARHGEQTAPRLPAGSRARSDGRAHHDRGGEQRPPAGSHDGHGRPNGPATPQR